MAPELAVADGALGFWQAIEEVWPTARGQRCWVHKTANVLNKLPKGQQSKAKRALQEIWMAETTKDALVAFDVFVEIWGLKYDKAIECLTKDRDALLARQMSSKAPARPSAIARPARRAVSRTRPRSP
jgi:putative transposase